MTIMIKYLADIKPIEPISQGDWIDLRSAVDLDLKKGDTYIIPLGVAMKLPMGYEAIIAPRSSTLKKWGIIQTNSIGIIDESYCGDRDEWCMPVLAMRDTHIHRNDRICQFRIIERQPSISFTVMAHLADRNRGGFGSTGER